MNHEVFENCLSIYRNLCIISEIESLSEEGCFNDQLKKDFENLLNYFDKLTDSEKIKLEDFVY